MHKFQANQKGIAIYLVLFTLFIVLVLTSIILNIMSSQTNITHHQVTRVQAYYAAQAAVNFALDMLRQNDPGWPNTGTYNRTMCSDPACDIMEPDLPLFIQHIDIHVADNNTGPNNTREITATVTYRR